MLGAVEIREDRTRHVIVENAPANESLAVDGEARAVAVKRHRAQATLRREDPALRQDAPSVRVIVRRDRDRAGLHEGAPAALEGISVALESKYRTAVEDC